MAAALALMTAPPARAADDVFATRIQPILVERCGACHGEDRQRGGLALHTPAALAEGGDSGPVLVAGKPAESEIIRRLRLPADDDDHMPPRNKPQPTEEEIKAIEAWIQAGAAMSPASSAPAAAPPHPAAPPESRNSSPIKGPTAKPIASQPADEPPAPDPAALAALRDHLIHVEGVGQGSSRLRLNFAAAARSITEAQVIALIEPVLPQVEWISLARCPVGDATATVLGRAPRLMRLDLRGSRITDAGVAALARIASLRELVLAQTKLTDAAATHLAAFPSLQQVYLWKSGVSGQALTSLRRQRPELQIDVGEARYATTQQVEPALRLTSDAPLPGQARPASAPASTASQPAATLRPINTVCPVSGKPIDARYTVIHGDRVIGFCCPNCPTQFWTDPARFESKLEAIK